MRVCKWRPKSACFLLRDHTLYGLLPLLPWSKNSVACAGASLCDGNRDKWYKQRGIHGSLKASVPNKRIQRNRKGEGLSECRDEDQPCKMRADGTRLSRPPILLRDRKSAVVSCLFSAPPSLGAVPSACFLLLGAPAAVDLSTSSWNLILSFFITVQKHVLQ